MTTSDPARVLPDLSTMTAICRERILLCGPCDPLMAEEEYHRRNRRLNHLASTWTETQRTEFWYGLDELCAPFSPRIRATPGLILTPENLAAEEVRIRRLAWDIEKETGASGGMAKWGFHLYTDPVIYSFTGDDICRYALAQTKIVHSGLDPIATLRGLVT